MESGRWRRGQAPLLAASSDSTHNRHPSPFSKTTLSEQAGREGGVFFSMCLLFFSSFLPGPSNPQKSPAEPIPPYPRWDAVGPTPFQPVLGWEVQHKERRLGAPLAPERPHGPGEPGAPGRERFFPTPKHEPYGRHRSQPRLRPRRFLLPLPPPATPYFHATGDPGAGRDPPPAGGGRSHLHPPARLSAPPSPPPPPSLRRASPRPRLGSAPPPLPAVGPAAPAGPGDRPLLPQPLPRSCGRGAGMRRRGMEKGDLR